MKNLIDELEANYSSFNGELKTRFTQAYVALESNNSLYLESYKRLSSLEAWKAYVLENKIHISSLCFFIEAQNDALLSHSLAKIGSWRPSLQSLRSAIENTLFCLYYKDHPVEYELWEAGKNQLPISDYVNYISKHPKYNSIDDNLSGIALLKREYSTLSRAVHATSIRFRMTQIDQFFPVIMLPDISKMNQWLTREEKAIQAINQILITMYFDDLQGAKLRNLRKAISFAIPRNLYEQYRTQFNIRFYELSDES
ncbi:MAG: hypothetical protein KKH04_11925 [Proteobacteria bacterium]|nr:hypothetical protein [Pseudomonadota bacterium]